MVPSYIAFDVDLKTQAKEAIKEWQEVYRNGQNTKVWTDGMYLNLLRGKIIRIGKLIKEKEPDFTLADIHVEVPEKMDFEYSAKKK